MLYMLQIFSGGTEPKWGSLSEAEQHSVVGEYEAISGEPGVTGGAQLQPTDTATTVRVEDGRHDLHRISARR